MTKDKTAWVAAALTLGFAVLGIATQWGSLGDRVSAEERRLDKYSLRLDSVRSDLEVVRVETAGLKQFEADTEANQREMLLRLDRPPK